MAKSLLEVRSMDDLRTVNLSARQIIQGISIGLFSLVGIALVFGLGIVLFVWLPFHYTESNGHHQQVLMFDHLAGIIWDSVLGCLLLGGVLAFIADSMKR